MAAMLLVVVVFAVAVVGVAVDRTTQASARTSRQTAAVSIFPAVQDTPASAEDDFARADTSDGLGTASSGQKWQTYGGRWGIRDGSAAVVRPQALRPSLALLPVARPGGTASVVVTTMADGAGLAFRCINPNNCWRVDSVPQFGTWNVVKTVRGKTSKVASLGLVPVADGTKVAVTMRGTKLIFSIDGQVAKSIDDPDLARAGGVGMWLEPSSTARQARWNALSLTPAAPDRMLDPAAATVVDRFQRADDPTSLGSTETGQPWRSLRGTWGIRQESAVLSRSGRTTPNLATVDAGASDGVLETTVSAMVTGAGLAFRCRDARSCWYVQPVPPYATWNVVRIRNGVAKRVARLELASASAGTTVAVVLDGPKMTFYVDGQRFTTVRDSYLQTERSMGLALDRRPEATKARYSELLFGPLTAFRAPAADGGDGTSAP